MARVDAPVIARDTGPKRITGRIENVEIRGANRARIILKTSTLEDSDAPPERVRLTLMGARAVEAAVPGSFVSALAALRPPPEPVDRLDDAAMTCGNHGVPSAFPNRKSRSKFALVFQGRAMTPETSPLSRAASAGDRVMSFNVLFGLPDDQKATIIVEGDGKPLGYDLVGTTGLLPHLPPERFKNYLIYLGPGRTQALRLGPGPLLNHIGDADICSVALKQAAQITGSVDRPCFNHPRAVARSTRDEVARLFAGIQGLTVPKTVRVRERDPIAVKKILHDAGFNFPVLVRIAGSHLGMNLIRVDTPDGLDAIRGLDRTDRASLYVTECFNFVSPDKRYRKFRVVVIGDEIFLRHCIIAEHWMIHRNDRASNTEDGERAAFATFDRDWKGHLQPIFREMAARLGLDYFGVDCNIDDGGRVLLFEANPCMNILANTTRPPNIWDEPIAQIKDALERRLAAPTTWRQFNKRMDS